MHLATPDHAQASAWPPPQSSGPPRVERAPTDLHPASPRPGKCPLLLTLHVAPRWQGSPSGPQCPRGQPPQQSGPRGRVQGPGIFQSVGGREASGQPVLPHVGLAASAAGDWPRPGCPTPGSQGLPSASSRYPASGPGPWCLCSWPVVPERQGTLEAATPWRPPESKASPEAGFKESERFSIWLAPASPGPPLEWGRQSHGVAGLRTLRQSRRGLPWAGELPAPTRRSFPLRVSRSSW